ncbi:MAG: alkyl/aryl-sulfatase [Halioglobus sp.]|nr:alkyl/aryl-sulfatase [Halioglobus sp.]
MALRNLFSTLAGAIGGLFCVSCLAANNAEELLQLRNAEFEREVIEVSSGVYTAVGYGVSPTSLIIGDSGLVIIDTQIDSTSAEAVLSEFRKITDKPVSGIILTHGHGDHTGGVGVFAAAGENVQIWTREDFNQETRTLAGAGLTIQKARGARQGGFLLGPEQRINNGVAKAYYPSRGGEVFAAVDTRPTHTLRGGREKVLIAGVELDLVAATGEAYDELYVWYPKEGVVFAGDNFYKSWPNLYAIRGTPYRDVLAWIRSLSSMIEESPTHLVGGHTRPVLGRKAAMETLTNYRDAIQSVFDQTIAGMNRGLTPDELVEIVRLPQRYSQLDYLKEYYGNIEWGVRAIFSGYLGWFDGNPTNLFPLSSAEEAAGIADLAGGPDRLLEKARSSLIDNPQWTAQLCDHLLALEYKVGEVTLLKADSLERLGSQLLTATGRNYYFTVAKQLRESADR